nr:immunoglobulin light chain junction region [Macaca mulatta]
DYFCGAWDVSLSGYIF